MLRYSELSRTMGLASANFPGNWMPGALTASARFQLLPVPLKTSGLFFPVSADGGRLPRAKE